MTKATILASTFQSRKINAIDFTDNSDWINYIFNPSSKESSTYNCIYCSTYSSSSEFRIKKNARSNLSAKEGILRDTPEKNHKEIARHAKLPTHIR